MTPTLAAIAPDILPTLLNLRSVVDRINSWSQTHWGDHALNIEYRFGVPVGFTQNTAYRFTGGGFVFVPPWRKHTPGYGTVWAERLGPDGVVASKRFALHHEVVL